MRQAGDVYVKIADYGISQFSSGLTLKVDGGPCVVGTPGFIAPEVIQPRGVCKSISADKVCLLYMLQLDYGLDHRVYRSRDSPDDQGSK